MNLTKAPTLHKCTHVFTHWSNRKPRASIRSIVSSHVHMESIDCNLSAHAYWPPFGMCEQTLEAWRLETMHLVLNMYFFFPFLRNAFLWIAGGGRLPTILFLHTQELDGQTNRQRDRQTDRTIAPTSEIVVKKCLTTKASGEWDSEWMVSG